MFFTSNASNLVAGDTNNAPDIFLLDRGSQDTVAPSLAATHIANGSGGWNTATAVTETVTAADADSGLAGSPSCTVDGAPAALTSTTTGIWTATVTGEGSHAVLCSAVDQADNAATTQDTVLIDSIGAGDRDRRDARRECQGLAQERRDRGVLMFGHGSGVASCPASTVLGEGLNQDVTGTATDIAGNTSLATASGINVEKLPRRCRARRRRARIPPAGTTAMSPSIGHAPTSFLGIDGSCPSDDIITGEGNSLSASESVSDRAGNPTTESSAPVRIDRTPPLTRASTIPSWSTSSVSVVLTAEDNLSGVDATYYSLDGAFPLPGGSVSIDGEGVHSLSFWSVDDAGNTEPPTTVDVRIETTAPTIAHTLAPTPDQAGWNNTATLVSFTCSPSVASIVSCTSPQTVSGEGAGQIVDGTVVDEAGLHAVDHALVSIDETPPTIQATPDRAANAASWYSAPVNVTFTCSDALSGVASCSPTTTVGEGGGQSIHGTSRDAADNTSAATLSNVNVDTTPPTVSYSGNAARTRKPDCPHQLFGQRRALRDRNQHLPGHQRHRLELWNRDHQPLS